LEDFKGFEGSTPLQKLARGLDHLVRNGELKEVQGVKTIHFTNKNGAFKIGLSRGWDHQGGNHWVITAYKYRRPPVETFDQSTSPKDVFKGSEHGHLAQKDLAKDSTPSSKSQGEDLLDPSKPLRRAKPEEITPEFLEEVKRTNSKVWMGDLTNAQILEHLGLDASKPLKFVAEGDVLKHVEARHGKGSIHARRGQPAIEVADIANYPNMVNDADMIQIKKHNNIRMLVSGKQINGYFIVIETVGAKKGQLILKTMYKEGGKLENSPVFKGGENIRLSKDSGESVVATDASLSLDAISHHQSNSTTPPLKFQIDNIEGSYDYT
ncbi:hypothetical protein ACFOPX_06565, partial [Helicobacter baculiformis]